MTEEHAEWQPENPDPTAIMAPPPAKPGEDEPPVLAVRPDDTNKALVGDAEVAVTDNITRQSYGLDRGDQDLDREDKLKELLLRQALENAPESLRDILNWAIEVAEQGYQEANSNIANLR
jgi:hypothetical protein